MDKGLKWFFFTLILSLVACTDNVPTVIPFHVFQQMSDVPEQLHLDIPSLLDWNEVSEIKMEMGESLELRATLENQQGESLPNQPLLIQSKKGNFFTENYLLTDHKGQATSLLLATRLGKDEIIVSTQKGLSTSLSIVINDLRSQWLEEKMLAKSFLTNKEQNVDK